MATFFSQIQHTYAPKTEDNGKEDVDAATFLAATRESLALLGNVNYFNVKYFILFRLYFHISYGSQRSLIGPVLFILGTFLDLFQIIISYNF